MMSSHGMGSISKSFGKNLSNVGQSSVKYRGHQLLVVPIKKSHMGNNYDPDHTSTYKFSLMMY